MSINKRIVELDQSLVEKTLYDINLELYYIDAITKVLLQKAKVLLPPHRELYTPQEITYTISELQHFVKNITNTLSYHGTGVILDSVQGHETVNGMINSGLYSIDRAILDDLKTSNIAMINVRKFLENLVL